MYVCFCVGEIRQQTNMEGQGEVSRLGDNNYENTDVGGGRIRSRDEEHESRSGSDNNGKHGTCTRPNKQRIISLVLPQTELAKGTLNPDMIVNEDSENLAPCPINILEETVVPIKMTHMQSSAVPRMDPFNQNITEFVSASPGENLHEYKFYLPDKPQDPVS